MKSNRLVIKYDGKVAVTKHSLNLGECSTAEIVHNALNLADDYAEINAEVEIIIVRKPDHPRVFLDGEPCVLEGDEC